MYRKFPGSGARPMPEELQKTIEETNKPKRGAKRKDKVVPSEEVKTPKKKVKKTACKPR